MVIDPAWQPHHTDPACRHTYMLLARYSLGVHFSSHNQYISSTINVSSKQAPSSRRHTQTHNLPGKLFIQFCVSTCPWLILTRAYDMHTTMRGCAQQPCQLHVSVNLRYCVTRNGNGAHQQQYRTVPYNNYCTKGTFTVFYHVLSCLCKKSSLEMKPVGWPETSVRN